MQSNFRAVDSSGFMFMERRYNMTQLLPHKIALRHPSRHFNCMRAMYRRETNQHRPGSVEKSIRYHVGIALVEVHGLQYREQIKKTIKKRETFYMLLSKRTICRFLIDGIVLKKTAHVYIYMYIYSKSEHCGDQITLEDEL